MREPQYSILADIQDAIERAKQGKLALYWQRTIQREYRCKKVTLAEQQAYALRHGGNWRQGLVLPLLGGALLHGRVDRGPQRKI